MPPWLEASLALFVATGLVGMVGPWLVRRLQAGQQSELERQLLVRFATRDDLNGVGERLTGVLRMAEVATANADRAMDTAQWAEQELRHWRERHDAEVLVPLREMAKEQREMGKALAAITALLERLTKQVDRNNGEGR